MEQPSSASSQTAAGFLQLSQLFWGGADLLVCRFTEPPAPCLEFGHSRRGPTLAEARAESASAYQPIPIPNRDWESWPLTTPQRPERARATEATPALAGRAVALGAGFPGRCPGLMCPHAVGVQNVRTEVTGPPARCLCGRGSSGPEARLTGRPEVCPTLRREQLSTFLNPDEACKQLWTGA